MTLSEALQKRGHAPNTISAAHATGIVYGWIDDAPWQQLFVIECLGCEPEFGVRMYVLQAELQKARFNVAAEIERQSEHAFEEDAREYHCPHWAEYKLFKLL